MLEETNIILQLALVIGGLILITISTFLGEF